MNIVSLIFKSTMAKSVVQKKNSVYAMASYEKHRQYYKRTLWTQKIWRSLNTISKSLQFFLKLLTKIKEDRWSIHSLWSLGFNNTEDFENIS